jgi:hypothetical protein
MNLSCAPLPTSTRKPDASWAGVVEAGGRARVEVSEQGVGRVSR